MQRGTHDELIADRKGEYARLLSHQALPGPRSRAVLAGQRRPTPARSIVPTRARLGERDRCGPSGFRRSRSRDRVPSRSGIGARRGSSSRSCCPYSQPERTAANRPLPLDDPEAVWWVSSGGVDVFFTSSSPARSRAGGGTSAGSRKGARSSRSAAFAADRAAAWWPSAPGPAQLLKFARGDLIRLSFEEGLSEQVAVLIDDWLLRVGRALGRLAGIQAPSGARTGRGCSISSAATRFGVAGGRLGPPPRAGPRRFSTRVPLPVTELEARFPLTEHLWLTAATDVPGDRLRHHDHDSHGRSLGGPRRLSPRRCSISSPGFDETGNARAWLEFRAIDRPRAALVESVSSQLAAAANETDDSGRSIPGTTRS